MEAELRLGLRRLINRATRAQAVGHRPFHWGTPDTDGTGYEPPQAHLPPRHTSLGRYMRQIAA